MDLSCCTCAQPLSTPSSSLPSARAPPYKEVPESEKDPLPAPYDYCLPCCARIVCGACVQKNPRFQSCCPYCQISTAATTLPQGLRAPPSYDAAVTSHSSVAGAPPPYAGPGDARAASEDKKQPPSAQAPALTTTPDTHISNSSSGGDVVHRLDHARDTLTSLALAYGTTVTALRRANPGLGLHGAGGGDRQLAARRTLLIPAAGRTRPGPPPRPPPSADEERAELRERALRRWQVACKVADHDVAALYLEQAGWDPQAAADAYFADEEWARRHPAPPGSSSAGGGRSKGKGNGRGKGGAGGGLTAAISRVFAPAE